MKKSLDKEVSYAEFEHLQDKVDTLENLLCDIVIYTKGKVLTIASLRARLKEAGILETD